MTMSLHYIAEILLNMIIKPQQTVIDYTKIDFHDIMPVYLGSLMILSIIYREIPPPQFLHTNHVEWKILKWCIWNSVSRM